MKRPIPIKLLHGIYPVHTDYPHPVIFGCGGKAALDIADLDRPIQDMNFLNTMLVDNKIDVPIKNRQAVIIHDKDMFEGKHLILTYGDTLGKEYTNDPEVTEIRKQLEELL